MRWFAFHRAMNVGGRTVKMARLAELFRELGFDSAETFIASGNVVFEAGVKDAAKLQRRIERAIADAFGFESETFLRTREELVAIRATHPFGSDPGGTVYVGFLREAPAAAAVKAVAALSGDIDEFAVVGRELYWLGRNGMGRSKMTPAKLERTLGMPLTLRNTSTIDRLLAKYP